jgi:hypothetical protein
VWPCWSLDGKTVYFSADGRTMASTFHTRVWPASAPISVPGADAWCWPVVPPPAIVAGSTGRRAAAGRAELRVVLEWFSELTKHQS